MNYLIKIQNNETLRNRTCFFLWAFLGILSYPMFSMPFIWVAFIPLIYAVHSTSIKNIIFYGFWAAFLYSLGTLYWLIAFHEASALFVYPLLGMYTVCTLILTRYAGIVFPKIRFLVFPLFWTAMEFFRSVGFLGFRWNTPADSLWNQIVFMQSADLIGDYGVTFLILLFNSILAEYLLALHGTAFKKAFQKVYILLFLGIFLFLTNFVYGIFSMKYWDSVIKEMPHDKVALYQPNRPGHNSWSEQHAELAEKYIAMAESITNQNPDLIVQTEIMISTYLWDSLILGDTYPPNKSSIRLINQAKELNIPIIMTHFDRDLYGRSYNAATLVKYQDNEFSKKTYRKIHIVPFGEWIPGSKNIAWLDELLYRLGAAWGSPGTEFVIFEGRNGSKFAMLICFEDIFALLGRYFVKKGTNYFVNGTNDGWAYRWKLGTKTPLWQHLANTVHTSISLRRAIARAVNTGITSVIDPLGRIEVSDIPEYKDGMMVANVPVLSENIYSGYVVYGWITAYVIYFTAILLAFCTFLSDKKSKILKTIL